MNYPLYILAMIIVPIIIANLIKSNRNLEKDIEEKI